MVLIPRNVFSLQSSTAGAFAVHFACSHDPVVLLISPLARTKKIFFWGGGDRLFSCATPRLWSLLPSTMRSTSSSSILKSRLNTFFYLVRHLVGFLIILKVSFFICNFNILTLSLPRGLPLTSKIVWR